MRRIKSPERFIEGVKDPAIHSRACEAVIYALNQAFSPAAPAQIDISSLQTLFLSVIGTL